MEQKLTKAAIIESIHEKLGTNRNDIHMVIDELFEEIKDGLKKNQIIELRGFGTFEVRIRKGREKARNPKTGDVVSVFGFAESPGLDGVVSEVNLGMLSVFVAPQVLQV